MSEMFEEGMEEGYRTPDSKEVEETKVQEKGASTPTGDVTPESLESMDQAQLLALAKQEGLDIDTKGMSAEQIKWAVAEGLGFEVTEEGEEKANEGEGDEGLPDAKGLEQKIRSQLEREYGSKLKQAEVWKEKARFIDLIESDPQTYVTKMAQHFGVKLEGSTTSEKFAPPKLEPLPDESLADYMARRDAALIEAYEKHQGQKVGARQKAPDQVQNKTQQVIQYLESNHPDYGLYLDEIVDVLKIRPELAHEPWKLYQAGKDARLAKRSASQTKKIIAKKGEGTTGERSTKPMTLAKPRGILKFDEAWERAKEQARGR